MKIGDLIRWRSTGCHGVITKIEETASGLFIHMLCSADEDGDGYGTGDSITACENPSTETLIYVTNGTDCDDENPFAHDTQALETCDNADNNCDGLVDENTTTMFYLDEDEDGYD